MIRAHLVYVPNDLALLSQTSCLRPEARLAE